jgi:ATP-binding cassette, subfamily F, member 3
VVIFAYTSVSHDAFTVTGKAGQIVGRPAAASMTVSASNVRDALELAVGGAERLDDVDDCVVTYLLAALSDAGAREDDVVEVVEPFLPEIAPFIAQKDAAAVARALRRELYGVPAEEDGAGEKPVRLAKATRLGAGIGIEGPRRKSASSKKGAGGNSNASLDRTSEAETAKEAAEKRRARRAGHQPKTYASRASVASTKSNYTPGSTDIHVEGVDLAFGGLTLLEGASLNVPYGRRVGFIGRNGVGKTTMMRAMARRELPIPEGMDIVYVEQEQVGSEKTPLQCVLESDAVRQDLIEEERELSDALLDTSVDADPALAARLQEVYKQLNDIDADKAESRAASILDGLGFSAHQMSEMTTGEFSGGWRMRIAIACALFVAPKLLLLDEPTNHLDMSSVLWLANHLKTWPHTVILVSHDRDFLNTVCTDIVYAKDKKLNAYSGNYDDFERVRNERMKELERAAESYEMKRAHVQKFVDKFRYNAKRAQMAQSRIKVLQRMEEDRVVMPGEEEEFSFSFPEPGALTGSHASDQICDVTFKYPGASEPLFRNLDFSVNMQSRICLLGPNGGAYSFHFQFLL